MQQPTPAQMMAARGAMPPPLPPLRIDACADALAAPPSPPPSREILEHATLEPYLQRAEASSAPAIRLRSATAAADAPGSEGAADSESDADVDSIENDDSPSQHLSANLDPPWFHAQNGRSYAYAPALDLKSAFDPTRTDGRHAWHDGLPLAPKMAMKDVAYIRVRRIQTCITGAKPWMLT